MKDFEFKILMNQRLCELADAIIYQYNPCKLDREKHSCIFIKNLNDKPCCSFFHLAKGDKCVALREDGECGFNNVFCKIGICEEAQKNAPEECLKTMKLIQDIAILHGIIRFRCY